MYGSYKEWKERGYYVKKGEHSCLRDKDNIPLFHEGQVEESVDYNEWDDNVMDLFFDPWMFD